MDTKTDHSVDLKVKAEKTTELQRKLTEAVGSGYRTKAAPELPRLEPKYTPKKWLKAPTYPHQIQDSETVRLVKRTTKVLDLSNPEQLESFNSLINLEFDPQTDQAVVSQDRRYDEAKGRFLVYLEIGQFEFLEVMPQLPPKSNEHEAGRN